MQVPHYETCRFQIALLLSEAAQRAETVSVTFVRVSSFMPVGEFAQVNCFVHFIYALVFPNEIVGAYAGIRLMDRIECGRTTAIEIE